MIVLLVRGPAEWPSVYLHHTTGDDGQWTEPPGVLLAEQQQSVLLLPAAAGTSLRPGSGWRLACFPELTALVFAVNNGAGCWENNGGADFVIDHPGIYALDLAPADGYPSTSASSAPAVVRCDMMPDAVTTPLAATHEEGQQQQASTDTAPGAEAEQTEEETAEKQSAQELEESAAAVDSLAASDSSSATATPWSAQPPLLGVVCPAPPAGEQLNLHFSADGGPWTAAPGLAMPPSGVPGLCLALLPATRLQFVFNNGQGHWNNNGGRDFFIDAPGLYTLEHNVVRKVDMKPIIEDRKRKRACDEDASPRKVAARQVSREGADAKDTGSAGQGTPGQPAAGTPHAAMLPIEAMEQSVASPSMVAASPCLPGSAAADKENNLPSPAHAVARMRSPAAKASPAAAVDPQPEGRLKLKQD